MKKTILIASLVVGTANAKIDYSVKYSNIENPFSIKDGYQSENNPSVIEAENIAENTQALNLTIDYRKKKKLKVLGFKVIPKLKLDGEFYLNADFDKNSSQYNLLNRDDVNDKVKKAEVKASVVAYRKLSKKSVLFLDAGLIYNSSYNLEFDTATVAGRIYDYGLVSTSHSKLYFEVGSQAKVHKKIRVDAKYKVTLSEYEDSYSIYDNVAGQTNDSLGHRISLNTNFKFSKIMNFDFNTFGAYKEFKNKLAFKENGYTQTSGTVEPQTELDYSVKGKLNFKIAKKLKPYISYSYFNKDDQINGASDIVISGLEVGSSYKFSKRFSVTGSFSQKNFEYGSAIASLEDENDPTLLEKDVDTVKIGLKFASFSFDYSNISNDSTREYDNITNATYSLGYASTF